MPEPRKLINEPPQSFQQVAAVSNDAKELLACHGTLHQWGKEITSASPVYEIGEYRWTMPWIVAAHDVVVRRLTQIKPKWEHDSPMVAPEKVAASSPIVLLHGALSVTRVSDREVAVDAEPSVLALGAVASVRRAYPDREVTQVPIVGEHATVYHLALVPDKVLRELKENRLQAAMDAFRAEIGSLFYSPRLRGAIVESLAALRANAQAAADRIQAAELGREAAHDVVGGKRTDEAKPNRYRKAQMKAAMERVGVLLGPLASPATMSRAEGMVETALDLADSKGSPSSRADAIDVALDIARSVGLAIRGNA